MEDLSLPWSFADVPLEVVLRCNKVSTLVSSVDELVKALKDSEMLDVSEDKRTVRRVTEVKIKTNIDDCSIYVVSINTFLHFVLCFTCADPCNMVGRKSCILVGFCRKTFLLMPLMTTYPIYSQSMGKLCISHFPNFMVRIPTKVLLL